MSKFMDELGDAIYASVSESVWDDAQKQQMADARYMQQKELDAKKSNAAKTTAQGFAAGVHNQQTAMNENLRNRRMPKVNVKTEVDIDNGYQY